MFASYLCEWISWFHGSHCWTWIQDESFRQGSPPCFCRLNDRAISLAFNLLNLLNFIEIAFAIRMALHGKVGSWMVSVNRFIKLSHDFNVWINDDYQVVINPRQVLKGCEGFCFEVAGLALATQNRKSRLQPLKAQKSIRLNTLGVHEMSSQ